MSVILPQSSAPPVLPQAARRKWLTALTAGLCLLTGAIARADYSSLPQPVQLRWQALLHSLDGAKIPDPAFLLSQPDFSPAREWQASYRLFKNNPQALCRFPARYRLIRPYSDLPERDPVQLCPGYRRFTQQVPVEQLTLVYASADVISPITMMGHVMLATEGRNDTGLPVRHSVSFNVELEQVNLLQAGWQSLVSGKEGFFLISPLQEHFQFYQQTEQRHVWSYRLQLPDDHIRLIRDHFWELKQVPLNYLFHRHNCATFSADLLRISQPQLPVSDWISPQDVVQAVHRQDLVQQTRLMPSTRWRQYQAQQQLKTPDAGPGPVFYGPKHLPKDSQLNLGLNHNSSNGGAGQNSLLLQWLPAAHTLEEYRPQALAETELKLAEISLSHNTRNQDSELHRLEIYSVTALNPGQGLTDEGSGRFSLGYKGFSDAEFNTEKTGYVEAGFGKSFSPQAGTASFYGLLNLGYRPISAGDDLYLRPELGIIFYQQTLRMKTHLNASALRLKNNLWQHSYRLSQTLDFKSQALVFSYENHRIRQQKQEQVGLLWKHYF